MQTSTTIRFNGKQHPFYHEDNDLAREILTEVLEGRAYPLEALSPYLERDKVKLILDVGANVGAASVFFAVNFPNADVWAYEPNHDAFSLLCKNVVVHDGDDLCLAHVTPSEYGLGEETRKEKLYLGKQDSVRGSIHGKEGEPFQEVAILEAATAIQRLFAAPHSPQEIDILKLDTEGCEYQILDSLANAHALHQIQTVFLEFHSAWDRQQIDMLLLGHSFSLCYAHIKRPHRGTVLYVRNDLIPDYIQKEAIG